jgi:L-alanine-DL-glutamate epimerase-like enolase superfamily enzyme
MAAAALAGLATGPIGGADLDGDASSHGPAVDDLATAAFTIPTDRPESDGTLAWDRTTMVVVTIHGGGEMGFGYTYADATAAALAATTLRRVVVGRSALDVPGAWWAMLAAVRNVGRQGIAACAISAIDMALWDLKAKLVDCSIVDLLGAVRPSIPGYGSGGFCSYDDEMLARQLGGWASTGFHAVKMKVGRDPLNDPHRVDVARAAIGDRVGLFVDANGAFDRPAALAAAAAFAERDVTWFEEPVTSDDLEGLRLVRDRAPAGMAIAAGEYAWDPWVARGLLQAGAVDVLQADATRCLGPSGLIQIAALCAASNVRLSSHCAPSLHVPLLCTLGPAVHAEWFHDHVRIERLLLDGAATSDRGELSPDRSRPGFGLELKAPDAAQYLEWQSER